MTGRPAMDLSGNHALKPATVAERPLVSSFAEFYRTGQHASFAQEHRESQTGDLQLFVVDQAPHDLTDAPYNGWILGMPLRACCNTRFDYGNGWRQARRGRGDALLVPPSTEVGYSITGPTRLLIVTWTHAAWREIEPTVLSDPSALKPLFERYFRSTQLEALCKNIWSDLARNDAASRLLLSTVHAQLAGILLRCANSPALQQTHRRADVRKAISFILDNLTKDISLNEIAGAAGLSVFHFSREFRIQTGQSPIGFVRAKRVELARTLLRTARPDMAQIALTTGFGTARRLRDALKQYRKAEDGA